MYTDNRSSERHLTIGLMSTVSDGKGAYLGVIEDISLDGVCVSQVPAVFDDTADYCITVVKGPARDLKILLFPRWAKATNRGMYKVIGFQIKDPPEAWKKFVEKVMRESDPYHALFAGEEVEV